MQNLYPFVYDTTYPFLFCSLCHYAVLVPSTADHLKGVHKDIPVSQRKAVRDAISQLPNMYRSKEDVGEFAFPSPSSAPIPHIQPPFEDGHQCNECGWITTSKTRRRMHVHPPDQCHSGHSPWRTGVRCQQLFAKGPRSVWFEVGRDEAVSSSELSVWLEMEDLFGMCSRAIVRFPC
jgi:hypothetical protein